MTEQWACNDDVDFDNGDNSSVLEVDMVAGETAVIVIDGYDELLKVITYWTSSYPMRLTVQTVR